MIDVGDKAVSRRSATASAHCRMNADTARAVRGNSLRKGDVLQVARLAAIGAAKRTDELIPLCHSIPLDSVQVAFAWLEPELLEIQVTAVATGKTGVEMEAMVGASLAALTVYDMCKSSDREMVVENVQLLHKVGGVRGEFQRANFQRNED
ncbi:Cyclic pyranopterin monophosphate synthase accessory protein [Aureliella helgolandensis]|uniref:cyclic pyranopterin monophosphate synthase n=2 Tax=Aureliella helgolandensis TaxID=2527968 RepID=A0A518GDF8_9BACT|nr:Cyclic pyranopterin monophosphate synthase accessory protein [Aureliella helgolandensis]